jgi:hypothetical protein
VDSNDNENMLWNVESFLLHIELICGKKVAYFTAKYLLESNGIFDESHDPVPNRVICT